MIRYRIVAKGKDSTKGYTLHLVRFISDERAREIMERSKTEARTLIHSGTPTLVAYKETFTTGGLTKTRVEVGRLELGHD